MRKPGVKYTPELLRYSYALLRESAPFCNWNMPDSHDVVFKVIRDRNIGGDYYRDPKTKQHVIRISVRASSTLARLIHIMGHEMVHLHQADTSPPTHTSGVQHNRAFKRLSDQVCLVHGFDRPDFAEVE